MKTKRTALSRATKLFLATSAIALSATVMAQFSGEMTQGALNAAAQAFVNTQDGRSNEGIQAAVATAMSAGVSAQAITQALITAGVMAPGIVIAEAIKQGGNPAVVADAAVNAIGNIANGPAGSNSAMAMVRSEALAMVKAAGGDVSGLPTTPGGAAVERIMRDMRTSPGMFSNMNNKSEMQLAIQQYGAQNLATALALSGVPSGITQMVNAIGDLNGAVGSDPKIASEAAALMDAIIKGTVAADPTNNTLASVQARVTEALVYTVGEKAKEAGQGSAAESFLKELSKTVDPAKLAAIASQMTSGSNMVQGVAMPSNVDGVLTTAAQLGIPLDTLTKAVMATGFTSITGFAREVDNGNGGKTTVVESRVSEGLPVGDTAAQTLMRLAGNSDADLKAVMAAVKEAGGNTDAFVTAAIEAGVDPAKVTAATASGTPSPAPAPAPVAGTQPSPAPAPLFSGSPPSSISGGGAVAVSRS